MATTPWNWKGKDGSRGGLLYESGNWGDLLKMLWLVALLRWKNRSGKAVNYFDPFAGDANYPLGRKTLFRFAQAGLSELAFIRGPFVERGVWPSSAAAAGLLVGGRVEVFDADPGRRSRWRDVAGVECLESDSGWTLLEGRSPDPDGVWLIDPYDFLAEWRARLPLILKQAEETSILLYMYNRSARSPEAFADYRAFRNALEDGRGDFPKRLGRIAADVFLPRSHHEMVFLPGRADRGAEGFDGVLEELGRRSAELAAALERAAAFDC